MTVVSTLDVHGLTAHEYRAVMDELGVETRPEPGIYLHLTTPTDSGFRVLEICDGAGIVPVLRDGVGVADGRR